MLLIHESILLARKETSEAVRGCCRAGSGTVSARGTACVGPGGGSCLWHTAVYMQGEVFMLLFSPQSLWARTSTGL